MIGDSRLARELAMWPDSNTMSELRGMGFRKLGSGTARFVFLGPDNVVYKHDMGNGANKDEFCHFELWNGSLPKPFALPQMHLFPNGILAAEFIDGEWCDDSDNDYLHYLESLTGLCDLWDDNIIKRDGILYIIDIEA